MGLKKGERVKKIGGLIRVKDISRRKLIMIDRSDLVREGFPEFEYL